MSDSNLENNDLISAIVCTRNRGDRVVETVKSILASNHLNFEIVVIDQSVSGDTEQAISLLRDDNRLRYIRSASEGLGRARNIGLAEAAGEVCCFTDDDCTVPPNWLTVMGCVFDLDLRVAVAFCNVDAGPYDPEKGFIPVYQRTDSRLFTSIRQKRFARGIGAGLAVRRSLVGSMGGFDEMLGAGGRFPSCEDGDIAVRALIMGHHLFETHEVSVTHFGFRTWQQGRELGRRDWVGVGAAYIKPLKCGHWGFLQVPAYEFWAWAVLPPLKQVLKLRKPSGLGRAASFLRGVIGGWRTPVDPKTLLFLPQR